MLRFSTTHTDSPDETVSLDEYIARMKDGQEKIYYVTAETFEAAKNSPHLEIFRKKDIEVLLLKDRVDEWLVSHFTEYNEKKLHSVARGDLDLGKLEDSEEKSEQEKCEKEFAEITKHMKEVLGDRVKEVKVTYRLTTSPACIVADEQDMQRILQSMGQEMPEAKPIFEVNPSHAIVEHLKELADEERFSEWVNILFEQAVLAEGGQLKNPAEFVQRLNKLLLQLV